MRLLCTFLLFVAFISSAIAQDAADNENKILIPYRNGKKWGYSDTLGRILIKPKFDSVGFFTGNESSEPPVAIVVKKRKQGVLNTNGKVVVPVVFDYVSLKKYASNALIFLQKEGKSGAFSGSTEIIPFQFDSIYFLSEKIVVRQNGKFGLYSIEGQQILPPNYTSIYAAIREGSNPRISIEYDFFVTLANQTFKVTSDGELIEIVENRKSSKTGTGQGIGQGNGGLFGRPASTKNDNVQKSIPPYQKAKLIVHNRRNQYIVKKDAFWGVIDEKGTEYIPVVYDSISLMEPFFLVQKQRHWGIINDLSAEILPIEYDRLEPVESNYLRTYKGNLKGIKMLNTCYPPIPAIYDDITYYKFFFVHAKWNFALFKVVKKGRTGFVGENGVEYFKH